MDQVVKVIRSRHRLQVEQHRPQSLEASQFTAAAGTPVQVMRNHGGQIFLEHLVKERR
jgi:hypothetical protein